MYDEDENLDQQGDSQQLMLDEEIDPDQYYDSEADQDFLDGQDFENGLGDRLGQGPIRIGAALNQNQRLMDLNVNQDFESEFGEEMEEEEEEEIDAQQNQKDRG